MAFSTPPRTPVLAGKTSPIVTKTATRSKVVDTKNLFIFSGINLIVSLFLFYELNAQHIQLWFNITNSLFYYAVLLFAVLFTVNSLVDFIQAVSSTIPTAPLYLSPAQKRLMGIKKSDPRFTSCAQTPKLISDRKISPGRTFSLTNLTNKPNQQQTSTPIQSHSPYITRHTPSPSPSPSSSFHTTVAAQGYQANIGGGSPYNSRLSDSHNFTHMTTPVSGIFDGGSILDSSGGSPYLRHRRSPFVSSTLSPDDYGSDQKKVSNYRRSQYEKERWQMYGTDSSVNNSSNYWGYNQSVHEYSGELSKNVYQLSTRSPISPTQSKDSKATEFSKYWSQAGISSDCMFECAGKLRRWISLTVISGVVKEIQKINLRLKKLGCPEIQIGESSLSALKQIQMSKTAQIPSLTWIMPYLELTNHQEYLVERLKTLGSGGYMSEFCWNKGGSVKGRAWADDLVTDAELVMHMFCSYLDWHLPAHPRYPDGKTFTSQYFVRTPDKPKLQNLTEHKMLLHQSKLNPPHYQLVTKETTYDMPPGRHNLFYTLLLFLHNIKSKEGCMLGPVNLGLSGINILNVLDPIHSSSEIQQKNYHASTSKP
uniref:Transmembrane protein 209 n=1 Tax=Ciona intestinalis TaxID=7719 RepID=F6ZRN6_CIOIN|nr:transmembrane protein 209 isoform X2 [Ciona intestinalis]|eukprot:XP_002132029.1 transmembrane protein 209 isoform X2 [Ciona intestinalis]